MKLKVKPLQPISKRETVRKNAHDRISSAKARLYALDLRKVQTYFQKEVKEILQVPDADKPTRLRSIKTLGALGRSIYGFRWASSTFHDDSDEAPGTLEDRSELFCTCLRAAVKIASEYTEDQEREAKSSMIAVSACLQVIAEVACIVVAVLLFLENRTWEAWTFVSLSIGARLFQLATVLFMQKRNCRAWLEALSGITVITDAYRIMKQKTGYESSWKSMDSSFLAILRQAGNGVIQFLPQTILNIHIIINMLEKNDKIGGLLWIQILSIVSTILAFAISMSNLDQRVSRNWAKKNVYRSISNYMPPDSKPAQQQVMFVATTVWIILHSLIVMIGVATLLVFFHWSIMASVVGSFVLVVTVLRAIVNRGELRFYRRMKPTLINNIISVVGSMILFGIAPAIIPLPICRFHFNLGPSIYGFVWIFSFGISVGVVFLLAKNIAFLSFFGLLCFLYTVVIVIVLTSCRGNTWRTFVFSTRNWKDVLRGELWDEWDFGSYYWGNSLLMGNEDAHYAGLIVHYLTSDLPLDKLKAWLILRKPNFLVDPPVWLTESWLLLIPEGIRNEVWTSAEMIDLKDAISRSSTIFHRIYKHNRFSISPTRRETKTPLFDGNKADSNFGLHSSKVNGRDDNTDRPSGRVGNLDKTKDKVIRIPIGSNTRAMDTADKSSRDIDSKLDRQKLAAEAKRRRSSIMASLQYFIPQRVSPSSGTLDHLALPIFLKDLISRASTLSETEVHDTILSALEEDFVRAVIECKKEEKDFPALVVGALVKHARQEQMKNEQNVNVSRIVFTAFCELADEVSDLVLAILFMLNPDDLRWAAVLMFVFMGLNRFTGVVISIIMKESPQENVEALLGIKCITDTYRVVTKNEHNLNLITRRLLTLACGLIFESLPQMVLQLSLVLADQKNETLDKGILAAQVTSIVASCVSLALSMTSVNVSLKIAFAILSAVYVIAVAIFLANIDENIFSFLFSTSNWKQTLRDELWDIPNHGSVHWGIPKLLHDHDANHAGHIAMYPTCDLPWEKIKTWLRSRKVAFLESPPIWMTAEWFDNLPREVKDNVWTEPSELEALITKVKDVCADAQNRDG
eukprot:g1756.t1